MTSIIWYITYRIPALIIELLEIIRCVPVYKRKSWNIAVYDGQTKNDFKKGNFIEFLYKVRIVKQLTWKDDDGRGYFIGYSDDDV